MSNRIITISREFGSGGRTIGKEVAEKLGIPCYDQELIEKIAEESGFTKDFIAERGEYTPTSSWFANGLAAKDNNGYSTSEYIWNIQCKIILELAKKGSCVIVGRCADFILNDTHECLKVFIHASMEHRAEKIVRVYGESDIKADKRLKDKDKRRKAYYQLYTDTEWGLAKNYIITLDSGVLGIEECVDMIADLYAKFSR